MSIAVFKGKVSRGQTELAQLLASQKSLHEAGQPSKLKVAHCKFTYYHTYDPMMPEVQGQDLVQSFRIDRILTGEQELIQKVKKSTDDIMQEDWDKFKMFKIEDRIKVMDTLNEVPQ